MLSYCAWSYLPQTVALSNITIFSGAIANMMFNLPRKHPFKAGPIIDYDLLLLVRACFRGGGAGRRGRQRRVCQFCGTSRNSGM